MIIDGKALASKNKLKLKERISEKIKTNRCPSLAIVLVGNSDASLRYIKGKIKACAEVGMESILVTLESSITTNELVEKIEELNKNDLIDGILVQLPLPPHIDKQVILNTISVSKDVDGFTSVSTGLLWQKEETFIPCTAKGIVQLLDEENVEIEGKNVCIIGRSTIVGLPVMKLLLDRNATVRILHSRVKNISDYTKEADIVIVAIGVANYLKKDMIKENAVVIDVGINKNEDNKLCGDVDFNEVKEKCSLITPVPGGVGPMTISCLLENTFDAYLKRIK